MGMLPFCTTNIAHVSARRSKSRGSKFHISMAIDARACQWYFSSQILMPRYFEQHVGAPSAQYCVNMLECKCCNGVLLGSLLFKDQSGSALQVIGQINGWTGSLDQTADLDDPMQTLAANGRPSKWLERIVSPLQNFAFLENMDLLSLPPLIGKTLVHSSLHPIKVWTLSSLN